MKQKFLFACVVALASIVVTVGALVRPTRAAAIITVTTAGDVLANDGACSLREAIIAANTDTPVGGCPAGNGADTIEFDAALPHPLTITLSIAGNNENAALTGDLDLNSSLTIHGPATIDSNQLDRVMEILPGAQVSLTDLQIQHGQAPLGGGIAISTTGVLTLTNSAVISNTATGGGGLWLAGKLSATQTDIAHNQGGGIHNAGGYLILNEANVFANTLGYGIVNAGAVEFHGGALRGNSGGGLLNSAFSASMTDVSVIGNTSGGGIYNASSGAAPATITIVRGQVLSNTGTSGGGIANVGPNATTNIYDALIAYNTASVNGGGIYNQAVLTLRGSTLDHNSARSGGGLHHNGGGSLTLINDTFSGNVAQDNGGGIYNKAGVILTNLTLAHNSANGSGGAIFNDEANSFPKNTIFFGNTSSDGSCASSPFAAQVSQGHNLDDDDTCSLTATGDITNTNPLLGPLQNNGGATPTHALQPGSPAIDHGTNSGCPSTDQRGLHRPQGASCDIGAYESGSSADLSVTIRVSPVLIAPSERLTYTLAISNAGPSQALSLTLTNTLPISVMLVSAGINGGTCVQGDVVTCALASLDAGTDVTATIVVTAPSISRFITDTAIVASALLDLRPDNNLTVQSAWVGPIHKTYLPLILAQ